MGSGSRASGRSARQHLLAGPGLWPGCPAGPSAAHRSQGVGKAGELRPQLLGAGDSGRKQTVLAGGGGGASSPDSSKFAAGRDPCTCGHLTRRTCCGSWTNLLASAWEKAAGRSCGVDVPLRGRRSRPPGLLVSFLAPCGSAQGTPGTAWRLPHASPPLTLPSPARSSVTSLPGHCLLMNVAGDSVSGSSFVFRKT